ncbi:MAG: hypothetical protein K8R68_05485 [Bacteroidales bacterium]|nr:hypothetical protein [Bacteroidales bacterium]
MIPSYFIPVFSLSMFFALQSPSRLTCIFDGCFFLGPVEMVEVDTTQLMDDVMFYTIKFGKTHA